MSPTPPAPTRVLRSQIATLNTTHSPTPNVSSRKAPRTTKRRKRLDPWYPKRKTNTQPAPRRPPRTHFTCRICISHLPRSDFIRWSGPRHRVWYREMLEAPADCISHLAHNPSRRNVDPVCKTCIGAFMAARLDTHGARRVSVGCIEPGCTTVWPWEIVMSYFPAARLEEYNMACFSHWRVDAQLFTCLAPDCDFTGLCEQQTRGYPQVACNACGFRSCAECNVPWHGAQTCAEVSAAAMTARMSEEEVETLRLMQTRDGKRCPNCQLVIEKDGGCPCMFCPGCKKSFDWYTAASVVPGKTKALPVKDGQAYYWQRSGSVMCEVDELERGVGQQVLDQYVRDSGFMCGVGDPGPYVEMPLPDEDDADL